MKHILINPPGTEEVIEINLKDFPIVYHAKIEELMEECGCSHVEAEKLADCKIALELYYHKGCGLFGVESEAVECQGDWIVSPYKPEVHLIEGDR